jgi:FKBP-type peptidyl-prolyl cis-trans isomerase (trigger factor)
MKTSQKQLPKSQVQIDVQLELPELEQYRAEAVAALAKEMNVEGFRPGHVSPAVAEKQLQETTILAEVARLAIADTYKKVLQEQRFDAIGEPNVRVVKLAPGNPLEFQITFAALSEVRLPDYVAIAKESEKREVRVEDKEIEDALQWLAESRKTEDGAVPEINDKFAGSLGSFENVAGLKESVAEGLQHEKETKEKDRVRQEILEHIAAKAAVEIPDLLIEREKGVLLQNVKQGVSQMMDISFEEYLQKSGKTEQELLTSFQEEAEKRVKRFLVLREIAKKEAINPTEEEIETEANNILSHYKEAAKAGAPAGGEIDPARLKEYTEGVIRHEKTLQFLEELRSV